MSLAEEVVKDTAIEYTIYNVEKYSNAENILIQFDRNTKNNKGYFTSEDKIFSFEIINNTLVIKNEETVVKYISGENY